MCRTWLPQELAALLVPHHHHVASPACAHLLMQSNLRPEMMGTPIMPMALATSSAVAIVACLPSKRLSHPRG